MQVIEVADDDYMSDKFLVESDKGPPPSYIYKTSHRREIQLVKRKVAAEERMKEKNKSIRVMEQEKREEGLASALSNNNKGFEMLIKMGYKPGQGIGKTDSGRTEPIPVDVKANRSGLGKSDKWKPLNPMSPTLKMDTLKTDEFRRRMSIKKVERVALVDFLKSQKVCEQLDGEVNVAVPGEFWFWSAIENEESSDAEEEEEKQDNLCISEKLKILTKYLRDTYFHCIWCGTTYNDDKDLNDNCPGPTRNDH